MTTLFSNTEFYYATPDHITKDLIILNKAESRHAVTVMRHREGDILYVTDGIGGVYKSEISTKLKSEVRLKILSTSDQENNSSELVFFIPILKSSERLEFALEKSIELGITNFVVYSAENSIKKEAKIDRLNKIALAAMKQSLRAHLPKIENVDSLKSTSKNNSNWIIFDQLGQENLRSILDKGIKNQGTNFVFGPEAGLKSSEIDFISSKKVVFLCKSRLRTETAIISAASIISDIKGNSI